jgi:hypothetical protein
MPIEIPDISQMARSVPSGRKAIATPDYSGIGNAVSQIGRAVGEHLDERDNSEYNKAKADFLVFKSQLDTTVEKDNDYTTLPDRYNTTLLEKVGELSSSITNPKYRDQFMNEQRITTAKGVEAVSGVAWGKERDFERSSLKDRILKLREAGLTGDVVETNTAVKALLDSSVGMNYIDSEESIKMHTSFKQDLAVGRVRMMQPEDRVEALKQSWATNIPTDQRAELMREAEKLTRNGKANKIVDTYMSDDLDFTKAMEKAEGIKDAELRREVETRFAYERAVVDKQKSETSRNLYNKYDRLVETKKIAYDKIPEDELMAMTPAQRSALQQHEVNRAKGRKTPFNVKHQVALASLTKSGNLKGAFDYFNANVHQLSTDQQRKWADVTLEGVINPDVDSEISDTEVINIRFPERKGNEEMRARLMENIGAWRTNYKENYGKPPTTKERDEEIKRMFMDYTTDVGWIWDTEKPLIEMDEDDIQDAIATMNQQSPGVMSDTAEYFGKKGIQPTMPQLLDKAQQLLEKRRAAQ